jgi:hypothetical protein
MLSWSERAVEFELKVLSTTKDERMEVILIELVKQMMELRASLDHISSGIHRTADSLA